MAFTDEDLKRFKKALECDRSCSGNVYLPHPEFESLLIRLEAAEKVCGDIAEAKKRGVLASSSLGDNVNAWLQSKGEGGKS